MSFQEKRIIPIEIVNPNSPAELLLALNQWLELELIADKRLELAINARENSVQETLALTIDLLQKYLNAFVEYILKHLRIW